VEKSVTLRSLGRLPSIRATTILKKRQIRGRGPTGDTMRGGGPGSVKGNALCIGILIENGRVRRGFRGHLMEFFTREKDSVKRGRVGKKREVLYDIKKKKSLGTKKKPMKEKSCFKLENVTDEKKESEMG